MSGSQAFPLSFLFSQLTLDGCQTWGLLFEVLSNRCSSPSTPNTGKASSEAMSKRYEDQVIEVNADGGLPSFFSWRGHCYQVIDVIGRWVIEGRWWADGREREYWRVEAKGGSVWDLYHDRIAGRWHLERLWD